MPNHNHLIKKIYGQNFLSDRNLLKKIVSAANIKNKYVIEIGPGKGALTKILVNEAKMLLCYEIDDDLKVFLDEILINTNNLEVLYEDFLSVDLNKEIDLRKWSEVVLIGNIPYYITSKILFKFLETQKLISATLMLQKEFADRITAKPKSKSYNALSVILQYMCEIKRELNVNKKLFFPIPKVDSTVISIVKKSAINEDFLAKFRKFVKAAFVQKRKLLINNLNSVYNISKEKLKEFLLLNGYNEKTRAEELEIKDFVKIVEAFNEN